MRRLLLPLLMVSVLLLMACASERYANDVLPHETWKDRGEYCFFVKVDPMGGDNLTMFWADEVEVSYKDGAETGVSAHNVRVSDEHDDRDGRGNSKEDFFQPGIQRVIEDGSISIDERCFGEAP